jgi:uncharacterized protein
MPMTSNIPDEMLVSIARTRCADADPAHDWLHVCRVMANARTLARAEHADEEICVTAALLHELFNYPKGHPESRRSGEVCAQHARDVLMQHRWAQERVEAVCYAIAVHPFSLGVMPATLEGKVLQDADRLDAIGAIGIARCFATCADMKRPFYNPDDPLCTTREPDDKLWGVDHFYKKLLKLEAIMHTSTARTMAHERTRFMQEFLKRFGEET